jgi:hypothetical protein
VRVSSPGGGGRFQFEFGGEDRTGPLTAPDTGDCQSRQTVSTKAVALKAGGQVMRVVFEAVGPAGVAGAGGHVCNLNWIRVRTVEATAPASGRVGQ